MFKEIIAEKFLSAMLKHSDRNAFCINDVFYSYSDFTTRISAISRLLESVEHTEIAIIANDDLDTYAAIFAVWFTGKLYVPLNPDTPAARNQNVIDQVEIKTILNSGETVKLASPEFPAAINHLEALVSKTDYSGQQAYIFFTSGSTGVPKGVMITKENVSAFVDAFDAMGYNINEHDRCLQMFELTFDLSVMSFLIPLLKGACVYTIPKGSVKYSYIFELMDEKELTVALMVPSILNYLRPYFDEIDCPKMRYSLFCGEALHEDVVHEWAKCLPNARIDNVYGPTEDTIFCTSYTYNRQSENDSHNGVLSIGKSMKNNLAVVFNENDSPADIGETGELCLAGAQLSPGYFNNPELNQKQFFTAPYQGAEVRFYRTGDLCRLRENGNIDYIGRKDFQAKIQGFRVELSEVEFFCKMATNNALALVAVAVENKTGNHEIAVIFESAEFDFTPVKTFLSGKLPTYMIPTQHFFAKPFPLNVNGKIDRKSLLQKILNSEIQIGQKAISTHIITQEKIDEFARLTGDYNPIHFDDNYAASTIFKRKIAHGPYILTLITTMFANKLPGPGSVYLSHDIKYVKPVYINDTITAMIEIVDILDNKHILAKTICTNQDNVIVIEGLARLKKF